MKQKVNGPRNGRPTRRKNRWLRSESRRWAKRFVMRAEQRDR